MNANKRMKYASTPTYGMQKRNFAKKAAAAQTNEGPDFTQVPPPEMLPVPYPQQLSPPPSAIPMIPQRSAIPSPPFFPPQQGFPQNLGMPSYGMPSPYANFPQPGAPIMPFSQPPLGNSAPSISPMPGVSPTRQQGYVPPPQPAPHASAGYFQNPAMPVVGAYSSPAAPPPFVQQPGYPPMMPAAAGFGAPAVQAPANTAMPVSPVPQMLPQAQFTQAPIAAQPPAYQPAGQNLQFMVFLFGILPALFVPCLFLPLAWDFVRYLFLTLTVLGLCVLWYKQMFTSATRSTISILYAALCVVVAIMLINSGNDTHTNGPDPIGAQPPNAQAVLQTDEEPDSQLEAAAPPATPSPEEISEISDAEKRLTAFMDYWHTNQIGAMVTLVQPSWATVREDPSKELFNLLANRHPESYTLEGISGSDLDHSRIITMSAFINKHTGKDATRYRFMIMMVKEAEEWYIDPNTLYTNDKEEETATPAPGAATTIALQTLPPRTTVTPVPPPATLLYYNPDGGKSYHADLNCASVNEKFLPLSGSFMYEELRGYLENYQPCLKCDAPVNPLPTDALPPTV